MAKFTSGLAALAAVASQPVTAQVNSYGKYEAPPYVVEQVIGGAEIRLYGPHILAEVNVSGQQSAALSQGFRLLAGYIFGGNTARQSVAMTSPVAQSESIAMTVPVAQSSADGFWTVSFMMPAVYTLDTLPVPDNAAISFREVAPHRQIVVSYSGRATEVARTKAKAKLDAAVAAGGLTITGPMQMYLYDDPMTLPWNRRNEVAYPISAE